MVKVGSLIFFSGQENVKKKNEKGVPLVRQRKT